jgi:aerobic-type carbon monoxide dehydrogenase small subunit (CoxS/CutS family)
MASDLSINVNGRSYRVEASPDTPLLYVLSNDLSLHGPRFGCGLAQCGSCSVLLDGVEVRSCQTPVATVAGKAVTTLEGLPAWYAEWKGLAAAPELHPLQQAFIDEQAPHCGYCTNGMIMTAKAFLDRNPKAGDQQIQQAMSTVLCRCASHLRMIRAIRRYAREATA